MVVRFARRVEDLDVHHLDPVSVRVVRQAHIEGPLLARHDRVGEHVARLIPALLRGANREDAIGYELVHRVVRHQLEDALSHLPLDFHLLLRHVLRRREGELQPLPISAVLGPLQPFDEAIELRPVRVGALAVELTSADALTNGDSRRMLRMVDGATARRCAPHSQRTVCSPPETDLARLRKAPQTGWVDVADHIAQHSCIRGGRGLQELL
mmetsp:Transcript_25206/g.57393  ORF Transcript_25206/g.57393 Transcript_25206/m.57393 type:complete len:211 (-) Transcript_25206:124-756(-)